MKKLLFAIITLGLLAACTEEKKPDSGQEDGPETPPAPVGCPDGAEDLGLSVYWAKSNLSEEGLCAKAEDYGDYYAWGEMEPHYVKGHSQDLVCNYDWRVIDGKQMTGYNWPSYKWCDGRYDKLTKYSPDIDNKTVLITGPEGEDVASRMLGGKWRMPTDAEWTELRTKCTWTWTDSYNETGVAGYIVSSKVDGFTNNSIFLPAAGGRSDLGLFDAGSDGSYWSSSLYTDTPDMALNLYFSSAITPDTFFTARCYGLPIRPVSE